MVNGDGGSGMLDQDVTNAGLSAIESNWGYKPDNVQKLTPEEEQMAIEAIKKYDSKLEAVQPLLSQKEALIAKIAATEKSKEGAEPRNKSHFFQELASLHRDLRVVEHEIKLVSGAISEEPRRRG